MEYEPAKLDAELTGSLTAGILRERRSATVFLQPTAIIPICTAVGITG